MSDMLFYDKIVPLDTDKHKNTKIALISDYSFTARTNSVPVAGIEFIASSKEFPITFIQNTEGKFIPVIILGMEDNTNLFVSDDGRWNAYYLPAYIRRYPFVPSVGDDKDKLNIKHICSFHIFYWPFNGFQHNLSRNLRSFIRYSYSFCFD